MRCKNCEEDFNFFSFIKHKLTEDDSFERFMNQSVGDDSVIRHWHNIFDDVKKERQLREERRDVTKGWVN